MANAKKDSYKEARSSGKSGKKEVDHYETRKAENEGHVVEHHFKNEGFDGYKKPDVFAFGSGPEMIKHLMDQHGVSADEMKAHLGDKGEKD